MADVIVAEHAGRCWLVTGEPHLDDLLMNALAPDVKVEIVTCDSVDAVHALWADHGGRAERGEQPWMIHPNILARVRNAAAQGRDGFVVAFQPWSAQIGEAAQTTIGDAARQALTDEAAIVVLTDALDPSADEDVTGLLRLRRSVVRKALVGHGVADARIRVRGQRVDNLAPNGTDLLTLILERGAA